MTQQHSGTTQLQKVTALIHIKELELYYAKLMALKYQNISGAGWISSIVQGSAGAFLAVLSGKKARKWNDEVVRLENEVLLLLVEKRIAEG